jgi:hypothetical protein
MASEAESNLLADTAPAADADPSANAAATVADAGATDVQQPATGADNAATENKPEAKAEGAPEAYELKAPEGRDFDDGVLGVFSEVARELNLSNDAAQQVIDKIAPALAEKFERNVQAARSQWEADTKSDAEVGGDKLNENLGTAKKALAAFGTPALAELLDTSGLCNHPEVVRLLVRAGRAISEDTMVSGSGTSAPKDPRSMYAASNMNP